MDKPVNLLSAGELAKRLTLSESTVRRYHRLRGMPAYRAAGGAVRFDLDEVLQWLRADPGDQEPEPAERP